MQILTKDVEINGQKFQIKKMTAMTGSWLSNLLVATALKLASGAPDAEAQPQDDLSPEERATAMIGALWLTAGSTLTEEQYARIQHKSLSCCARHIEGGNPISVMMSDGRFADKELEQDGVMVGRLIMESLTFNLTPFFLASASSEVPRP